MKNSSPYFKFAPLFCASLVCVFAVVFWLSGGGKDSDTSSVADRSDLSGIVYTRTKAVFPDSGLPLAEQIADRDATIEKFDAYLEVWAASTDAPSWLMDAIVNKETNIAPMASDNLVGFNGNSNWNPNSSWLQRAVPKPVASVGGGGAGAAADFQEMQAIPYVCFAKGTAAETVEEARRAASAGFADATGGEMFNALAFQFFATQRWGTTAAHTGGLSRGDSTVVTWSIVPDGTELGNGGVFGESTDGSNFNAWMTGLYGSRSRWLPLMQGVFDSWSNRTGVQYVFEPNDDGAEAPVTEGVRGVRGDARIGGHSLDGNSGVLAYNYAPNVGDMVMDTGDNYFSTTTGGSRRFRSVFGHELGHGLGLAHTCPINETKLMEPFANDSITLPQADDIFAAHLQYGDNSEDDNANSIVENNDSIATPTQLGILPNRVRVLSPLSIHDATDNDFFGFETTGHTANLTVSIRPQGSTYPEGEQTPSCDFGEDINTLIMQDIGFDIHDSDGVSVLGEAILAPAGDDDVLADLTLPVSTGPFYIHVFGNGGPAPQIYTLDIRPTGGVFGPEMTTVNTAANEADGGVVLDLQLSEAYALSATLDYVIEPITASIEDFPALSGSITIPAGVDSFPLTVPVTDDSIDEPIETFRVRFMNPYHLSIGTTTVIGTILDDDVDPSLSIAGTGSGLEPFGAFPAVVDLSVTLSDPRDVPVTAQINVIPISATADVDYDSIVAPVTLAAGATNTMVRVTLLDDDEPETDETFIVQLINPTGGVGILHGTSLVTIQDNDSMALLAKSMDVSVNSENDDITIEWDAVPDRPYTILTSTDLVNWEPLAGGSAITSSSADGSHTFSPESGVRRFYRMTDAMPVDVEG